MRPTTQAGFDKGVRAAIAFLDGRGYRDPLGRPAEVHLCIEFFGGKEYDDMPRDVATDLDEMESTGRL